MATSSPLYIIYAIIKYKQDFTKTGSLYKSKNYKEKKNFFSNFFCHWKNGCTNREEDAFKHGWDIYCRDVQETQKLPQ